MNRATTVLIAILWSWSSSAGASDAVPHYKPSSRAPQALDITTNSYGFSRTAPEALELGVKVDDFLLPRSGGGTTSLETARHDGPVVIIFYRGHW